MALWKYLKGMKDGLCDPRGSLANEIFSRAIEQANQEVWQCSSLSQQQQRIYQSSL